MILKNFSPINKNKKTIGLTTAKGKIIIQNNNQEMGMKDYFKTKILKFIVLKM